MTTLSLSYILTKEYGEPVTVHRFRIVSASELALVLEVEIQVVGEQTSKTLVQVVHDNPIP